MTDQLTGAAAEVLAARFRLQRDDPEPQIAATASWLWWIQFESLRRNLDGTHTPAQVERAVATDVDCASLHLQSGLRVLGRATAPHPT